MPRRCPPPVGADAYLFTSCLLKFFLVVAVAGLIMYLPLDEVEEDLKFSSQSLCLYVKEFSLDFSENATNFLAIFLEKCCQVTELLLSVLIELTYEAKMKLYQIMHKLDGEDMCKVISCAQYKQIGSSEATQMPKDADSPQNGQACCRTRKGDDGKCKCISSQKSSRRRYSKTVIT